MRCGPPRVRWRHCPRCLADFDLMADAYVTLAADYDWLFDDDVLADGGAINQPAAARLLQRISRTSAVLDAACGTGIDAAVLARRGFTVWRPTEARRWSRARLPGSGGSG